MSFIKRNRGVLIALAIMLSWSLSLWWLLHLEVDFYSPFMYLAVLVQTHMYTGLFITAHDAMHGAVSGNRQLNKAIGVVAAGLFAFNSYNRLFPRHHQHHRFVATDRDPDYHGGAFLPWYYSFLKQYITWQQILLMALTYHLLKLAFPVSNLVLFWIVPSVLSTFQLFYFGTFLPHRGEHAPGNPHKSGSLAKNHLWAFLSCYFFGYHYEHHEKPGLPWWQLYREKDR